MEKTILDGLRRYYMGIDAETGDPVVVPATPELDKRWRKQLKEALEPRHDGPYIRTTRKS